ncbi:MULTISPECIES: NAD(P)/FAD-dependent oxidoreductase [Rhodococcus]|uniref:NAD(P)/FAD-dependent oxidoreductase n=1 Tax=Rhodococcus globerulus TaxID=33008 RepID=UPI001C5662CD|nr:NAD(P)/FAD-dependent oxidoreductase [Rhodococcus globerulus]QXW02311.1 NAD(P)/FAD-dependent oxidoreductase [Rhodococcus globerulus]
MSIHKSNGKPRVVIVGGGFGGLYAAKKLKKADVEVVLIDRGTSHVFQPLLYQCATGLLSEGQIASPLRHLLEDQKNTNVVLGEAKSLDAEARLLTASRFDGSTFGLPYDYLIVAAGMRQSYHGQDDFIKWAPGMKTLDDALAIRRSLIAAFEMAESLPTAEERRPWLTFAVAGGGPTGVEIAGQIRELAMHALTNEFRSIDPDEARVLLFHGDDRVLPSFNRSLSAAAARTLEKIGVETHLGVHVTDVSETEIETTDKKTKAKQRYETRTILWTAGVEAVPFVEALATALGVKQVGGGRIDVEADLTVPGHPNIWVVGDIMSRDKLPGVAEVAMQGGRYAGAQIAARVENGRPNGKPFKYRDLGTAAYISRRHALLQAGPIRMSGFIGWVSWGVIHIAFLAGFRNRVSTALNWGVTLASKTRRERAITFGDPETARQPYN